MQITSTQRFMNGVKTYLSKPQNVILLIFGILLSLCACTNERNVAGGTEAESTIALHVQLADGTPAARTRVRILPRTFLANGISSESWTETDENGQIIFAEMDSGTYTIEARLVENAKAFGAVLSLDYAKNEFFTFENLFINLSYFSNIYFFK